jgi:C1A family cysteine protease
LKRTIALTGLFSILVGCGQVAPSVSNSTIGDLGAAAVSGHPLGFKLLPSNRPVVDNDLASMGASNRPKQSDLRTQCSPVANQGHLGACTAFAMGKGLREFLENKSGKGSFTALSPLYLYYKEREAQGSVNEDSGSTITEGMRVLKNTGICPEADDPYDITKFTVAPSAKAERDAADFKVSETSQVGSLSEAKDSLAAGYPVAFGFMVYQSFRQVGADGMMPLPKAGEQLLGGHAVLAVGYDDTRKVLIVRNSWGPDWGDKGYFYMPYKFVTGRNVQDMWTAR